VTLENGKVMWSKLGGQGFPDPSKVVELLKQELKEKETK